MIHYHSDDKNCKERKKRIRLRKTGINNYSHNINAMAIINNLFTTTIIFLKAIELLPLGD